MLVTNLESEASPSRRNVFQLAVQIGVLLSAVSCCAAMTVGIERDRFSAMCKQRMDLPLLRQCAANGGKPGTRYAIFYVLHD